MRKSSDCRLAGWAARVSASLVLIAFAGALAGCSVSVPLAGFIDDTSTGSIKPKTAEANPYDPGDWTRAEPALADAMKAEAGKDPAGWVNPDTGRKGRIMAVAAPFKRDGAVCRALIGRIEDGKTTRDWQGVGCRGEGERVVLQDVSPWRGL